MDKQVQDKTLFEIEKLSVEFRQPCGWRRVVCGVSLKIGIGEVVGLVGESGSGKSVTALSIARLFPEGSCRIAEGKIRLLDDELTSMPDPLIRALRGSQIAYVFQEPMMALNPTRRIGKQLIDAIRAKGNISKADATKRAVRLLDDVLIADSADTLRAYPFQLSGGMRQRVLIAMAFASHPRLIIADEPTTALDVTVQAQIVALLQARSRDTGAAILFISHDLALVSNICDRVYVMYSGRIVESGPAKSVVSNPAHPYTQMLLRSLPDLGTPGEPLEVGAGSADAAPAEIDACVFRDRCVMAHEACHAAPPMCTATNHMHEVACWLHQPSDVERSASDMQAKR